MQSLHVGVIQDTMQVADTISPNVYRRIKSVHNDSAESKLHIIAMLTDTCRTISHSSSSKKRSRRRRPSGQVVREVRRLRTLRSLSRRARSASWCESWAWVAAAPVSWRLCLSTSPACSSSSALWESNLTPRYYTVLTRNADNVEVSNIAPATQLLPQW